MVAKKTNVNRKTNAKDNINNSSEETSSKDNPEVRRSKVIRLYGTMTVKEMANALGVTPRTIDRDLEWLRNNNELRRRGLIAEELMKLEAEGQANRLRTEVSFAWDDLLKAREELEEVRYMKGQLKDESSKMAMIKEPNEDEEDKMKNMARAWDQVRKSEDRIIELCLRLQFEHRSAEAVLAKFYLLTGGYQPAEDERDTTKKPSIVFNNYSTAIPSIQDDQKRILKGVMNEATKTAELEPAGGRATQPRPPTPRRTTKKTTTKKVVG